MNKFNQLLLAGAAVAVLGGASAAQAADLIVSEPAAPAPVAAASGNWAGPYVGIFAGGATGFADHDNDDVDVGPFSPDGADLDLSGMLLGIDAGVNFQLSDNVIGGIVGDLAWSNVSGSDTINGIDTENSINWQGSARGLLGFDGGNIMPYLTAGVAFANASHLSDFDDDTIDATHIGWTAGVGVAIAATDTMRINLEYRHSDFGDKTYDAGAGDLNPKFTLTQDAVTIGLNWAL